jgi:predicted O-methyltransferase YrrM
MGSGFGYSAYWFAKALTGDGRVVLTDYGEENIASARETFRRAGMEERGIFRVGDAIETVREFNEFMFGLEGFHSLIVPLRDGVLVS